MRASFRRETGQCAGVKDRADRARVVYRMMTARRTIAAVVVPLIMGAATRASAQRPIDAAAGVHLVPLLTHVDPIIGGDSRTEFYITQPTLLGTVGAFDGALRIRGTISLEGLTLERGELGPGTYGEGYVDRRHPHTYLHELVVTVQLHNNASLTAGRGFAPFGTDDPMMRPFVKFPVNHHLGQVLERLVLIGAVRRGPVVIEAGLFNGSEPLDPEDLGSLDRFGDSWAARLTVLPAAGLEFQASHAWLESPEFPDGGGWDQRKWSVSSRYERAGMYVLAEWKRTTEIDRGTNVFSFGSILAEAMMDFDGWRPALRVERSERPEEQRLADPFRTPWPHFDNHVLGITRWTIVSARIERATAAGPVRIAPFVEASFAHVGESEAGVFQPREFYGDDQIWTLNLGARLNAGWHPARMGRYGVAHAAPAATHAH